MVNHARPVVRFHSLSAVDSASVVSVVESTVCEVTLEMRFFFAVRSESGRCMPAAVAADSAAVDRLSKIVRVYTVSRKKRGSKLFCNAFANPDRRRRFFAPN